MPELDAVEAVNQFNQNLKQYIGCQPLDMYYPDDIQKAIEVNPRDQSGFWLKTSIWVDFDTLNAFADTLDTQTQTAFEFPVGQTLH